MNKSMRQYSDYIGVKLEYVIDPYQYRSARDALTARLKYYIKKELNYYHGLECDFKKIKTDTTGTGNE